MTFRAPVRDLAFSLTEAAGVERLVGAYPDFDLETMHAVLGAAGQFADEVLAPINRVGDLKGATYANGAVTAAPGFADAYRQFAAGGWTGLAAEADHGGAGLPKALELACYEAFHAANMAFGLCPMLSIASIEALQTVGSERQKEIYLSRLVSGEWTGAMVLTEPHSGSDLGVLRTTATPNGDGTYALTGQKIFITWGDHDASENIVHLVLARLPDAPAGSKGISLFLAPKFLVREDGGLGDRNQFRPVGVEHKLGIHASPTCVMSYEGATAELVGQPNQGLAHMFIMMNAARLAVGVEGVGIAERAYQQALAYALDRRQGRSAWSGEASAPIFDHPDVRRMLACSKARIEAARGICLSTAVAAGLADTAPTDEERARHAAYEALMVPIAKAWSTDMACEVASLGVQIHGGMGFIEETGAAQHYRDARITPIYEGTNGIQAMDLTGRKLSGDGGAAAKSLIAEVHEAAAAVRASAEARIASAFPALQAAASAAGLATDWLLERKGSAQADVLAGSAAYLRLMGDMAGGLMLARGALGAARRLAAGEGDPAWLNGKIDLLRVYAATVLPHATGLAHEVAMGSEALQALGPEALAV
ncbi:MAG: acyl-CoA dehydrogenase [Caulobacteraceae bacterium]|nr:acyl-CoA dehydrogenase [Caulobacteraceae bacterium]